MGSKTPKTSDRRIERTRKALREAMISLLLERSWDEIRVQDICDRADIGRSTFYMHYADKEDLLIGGFADLRLVLRQLPPSTARRSLPFARGLIEHAYEQRPLFRALVGKHGAQVVVTRFRELILELVREDLEAIAPPSPARDAATHFIAGGFFELLVWSLDAGPEFGPAEVDRMFRQMAGPALRKL